MGESLYGFIHAICFDSKIIKLFSGSTYEINQQYFSFLNGNNLCTVPFGIPFNNNFNDRRRMAKANCACFFLEFKQ